MARRVNGRNPYASNISVEYESGAVDIVKTYSYLLKEFNMSRRFPIYLKEAVHRVADRRFDAYMVANREEYKHVFEWGAKSASGMSKLWYTLLIDDFILFDFRESRKLVPAKLPHTKYRHVFREKARVMEEAPLVDIAPVKARYLRWRGEGGGEVRHYGKLEDVEVAGGKYKNKFETAFLLFWATGAGSTMADMAHAISSSPEFRFEYKHHQLNGLKTRIKNQQKKAANTNDPKIKAMAEKKIKEYERGMKRLGGTL